MRTKLRPRQVEGAKSIRLTEPQADILYALLQSTAASSEDEGVVRVSEAILRKIEKAWEGT